MIKEMNRVKLMAVHGVLFKIGEQEDKSTQRGEKGKVLHSNDVTLVLPLFLFLFLSLPLSLSLSIFVSRMSACSEYNLDLQRKVHQLEHSNK